MLGILAASAIHRTPDCPGDHEIADGVVGQLSEEARDQFQRHIADCDFCIHRVGLLSHLHASEPTQPVSEFVLARARRLGAGKQRQTIPYAPRWAAAAVVVAAITISMNWDALSPNSPETISVGAPLSDFRSADPQTSRNRNPKLVAPRVLSPANGATVDPGNLVFRWTGVPGSLYYDVRVVSDEGDLIWQERVENTSLDLSEHLLLVPGAEYFIRVDAYLAAARNISSRHVLFTIKEQR